MNSTLHNNAEFQTLSTDDLYEIDGGSWVGDYLRALGKVLTQVGKNILRQISSGI